MHAVPVGSGAKDDLKKALYHLDSAIDIIQYWKDPVFARHKGPDLDPKPEKPEGRKWKRVLKGQ